MKEELELRIQIFRCLVEFLNQNNLDVCMPKISEYICEKVNVPVFPINKHYDSIIRYIKVLVKNGFIKYSKLCLGRYLLVKAIDPDFSNSFVERLKSKSGYDEGDVKFKRGYLTIKSGGKWKQLARHTWESHFGTIPKGYIVRYKNNDVKDCSIKNLYIESARDHLKVR